MSKLHEMIKRLGELHEDNLQNTEEYVSLEIDILLLQLREKFECLDNNNDEE